MTPADWRALAHRHPGRVVYPSFNPDRPREPWVPVKDNRTWWERNKPRQATFTPVRARLADEVLPALPPSGGTFNPDPGRDAMVPYPDNDEKAYKRLLQDELPPPRRHERGWWI